MPIEITTQNIDKKSIEVVSLKILRFARITTLEYVKLPSNQ